MAPAREAWFSPEYSLACIHPTAVCYVPTTARLPPHERNSHLKVAAILAQTIGVPLDDATTLTSRELAGVYLVPDDTIIGIDQISQLGITSSHDFFGGAVPFRFVAGKALTHGLIDSCAFAPSGWQHNLGDELKAYVLSGYSAFSHSDAIVAGKTLLEAGPVRLKPVNAKAGRGQTRLESEQELRSAMARLEPGDLATYGVVVEEDLREACTYSIGEVEAAGITISYWGTQSVTCDNAGAPVYGGSRLIVTRGTIEELARRCPAGHVQTAARQAAAYDRAVRTSYPAIWASRRNYDVMLGTDVCGQTRSGVLEQSWRIGGASPAEAVSIKAMAEDPALRRIDVCAVEAYGKEARIPSNAVEFYPCEDPDAGFICKYVEVNSYDRAA